MAYYRKCIICGCSLDPGEGNICEDCIEDRKKKEHRQALLTGRIMESESGQMMIGGLSR